MSAVNLHASLVVTMQGDLLVGGQADAPAFLDAATARDKAEQPIIPASALKGALREALIRLVRGRAAGSAPPPDCDSWSSCGRETCAVCRIFGAAGPNQPGFAPNEHVDPPARRPRLFFEDASLVSALDAPFAIRNGVSIDRKTGHAAPGRLFVRQVASVAHQQFRAKIDGVLDERDVILLEEACRLVDGIGNSRSRGLGHAKVELVREVEVPGPRFSPQDLGEQAVIQVRACSDLHLGAIAERGNVRRGMVVIPGSAMMGALAWALVDSGVSDGDVGAWVNRVSISDCAPAVFGGEIAELTYPAPRTALGCRKHKTVVIDGILRATIGALVVERVGGAAAAPLTCPKCHEPLRPISQWMLVDSARPLPSPTMRTVTRLAMDAKTSSHVPGMLHLTEQVPSGTGFVGTIFGLNGDAAKVLKRLRVPVRVGGLRSRGLGRVEFRLTPYRPRLLQDRIQAFSSAVQCIVPGGLLARLGLQGKDWVRVVARTPLSLPDDLSPNRAGEWLAQELFGEGEVAFHRGFFRDDVRSGWDQQLNGPRPLAPVIAAGATWLFLLRPNTAPDLDRLARAETAGVGPEAARRLGLGRLTVCPRLDLMPRKEGAK